MQQLRRNLNRLSDANRAIRLQGINSILFTYTEEAAKRAPEGGNVVTADVRDKAALNKKNNASCCFAEAFLSNIYSLVAGLCADGESESSREAALQLLQLVVKMFLSREEVIAICTGIRRCSIKNQLKGLDYTDCAASGTCYNTKDGRCHSSSSGPTNTEAAKPLVLVLSDRLKEASGQAETSEELRFTVMKFLQDLLVDYATDLPVPESNAQNPEPQEQLIMKNSDGWNATDFADSLLAAVAGALRDQRPTNAVEACRLLAAVCQKVRASVLLQVRRHNEWHAFLYNRFLLLLLQWCSALTPAEQALVNTPDMLFC